MLKIFKISFSIIFFTMLLMVTLIWFWKNDAFELKAVKIQGNHFIAKEDIFELAGIDFSKDIFGVDTGEIEKRILKHGMIEKVAVTRFLPSALRIKVKERNILAVISGSDLSAVDVNGKIFSQFPAESIYDLPAITGFHFRTDSTGRRRPDHPELVQKAIYILSALKTHDLLIYHELSDLHYHQNQGFILYLKKKSIPVILGLEDYSQKLNNFLVIYHYLLDKNELEPVKLIDLRFKDQVVVKS